MPQVDIQRVTPRAPLVVTTAYVPSANISLRHHAQLILYPSITLGSLTSVELIVEFSPDGGITWYQETDETTAATANVDTRAVNKIVHQFTVAGNYRLSIPTAEHLCRVSVKGTGTVAGSSVGVDGMRAKTYS